MNTAIKPLPEFVQELPFDIQIEVRHFAEFLLEKRKKTEQVGGHKRQLGFLKDSIIIVGDIVAPACDESE